MSNEALKLELIEWLARLDDRSILKSLLDLKMASENDSFYDQIAAERNTSYERQKVQVDNFDEDLYDKLTAEQKASIERGREDIAAGKVISSEDLWKKYGKTR